MVSLLELPLTNFNHVFEVSPDCLQKLAADSTLTCKEPIKRVLMFCRLLGQSAKLLKGVSEEKK